MMCEKKRPVLKYPGSKWRMADWIISLMPPHKSYLEPFFGSGAVFFNKKPSRIETINDLDGEIVNLFRCVREWPEELACAVALTPYSREEYERAWSRFKAGGKARGIEDARLTLVRYWQSHGSTSVYKGGWKNDRAGREYETGMPIGNLTSQLFANIYLNELDQYCKHKLKIHYYIRYMDDVIILGPNKWVLREWKEEIEKFLETELHLDLNTKTSIRPMKSGIEFVGVKIWPTHMKLRKSTVRRIKRETRKISRLYASGDMARDAFERRVTSIRGMLKHAECASLRWRLNEIYREEMERAKNKEKEVEYEPFEDHSGTGERNGNSSESD